MDEWLMPGIPRTIAEDPDMETVRRIRESVTDYTGQVVDSDLLLDCPFCGGRPWVGVHELDETCVEARVVCGSCHVSTSREFQSWKVEHLGDDLTRTLAIGRAISAWNRRAEPGEAFVLVARESRCVPISECQLGPGEAVRATVEIAEACPVAASSDVHALRDAMSEIEEMQSPRLREWNIMRVPFVGGDRHGR